MNTTSLPTVNIGSSEFKKNPYPFYARLRAEAPVYQTVVPGKITAWLITRYDDVVSVLKDDQHFVKDYKAALTPEQIKKLPWVPPMFRPLEQNLLAIDGEYHIKMRGLVHKAFTPKRIEEMRAMAEALSNELIDAAVKRGSMDLMRDYALPIPLTIISKMLGVPQRDQDKFHRWIKKLLDLSGSDGGQLLGLPAGIAMMHYLRRLIEDRRRNPQDDLITALVQVEEDGQMLTPDEIVSMVFILLVAGHETTVNLIGSGSLALMENPDQMRLLRQQPELIKSAIEELVRYVSPVEQATERWAIEDVTMHGVTIPKGGQVLAVLASANRDETHFENPDRLDITRQENKHISFGLGVHYCVGAPLARLEGQIAINMLVQRLPDLRLATRPDALKWRPGMTVRGLEALPVAV